MNVVDLVALEERVDQVHASRIRLQHLQAHRGLTVSPDYSLPACTEEAMKLWLGDDNGAGAIRGNERAFFAILNGEA